MSVSIIDRFKMIQIKIVEDKGELLLLLLMQNAAEIPFIELSCQTIGVCKILKVMTFANILCDHHDL